MQIISAQMLIISDKLRDILTEWGQIGDERSVLTA